MKLWRDYQRSWQLVWCKETLFHIGLDLGVLFSLCVLFFIFFAVVSFLSADLVPILQSVAQLEASNPTQATRAAFAAQHQPLFTEILSQLAVLSFLFLLLAAACYALFKYVLWSRLTKSSFSWKRYFFLAGITLGAWLCLLVPFLLSSPAFATALFLLLFLAILGALPALYAGIRVEQIPRYLLSLLPLYVTWQLGALLPWLLAFLFPRASLFLLFCWLLLFLSWGRRFILEVTHA
jgi:hypothetical protein